MGPNKVYMMLNGINFPPMDIIFKCGLTLSKMLLVSGNKELLCLGTLLLSVDVDAANADLI